jgi:SAM-dependent methyltransferase
MLGYRVTASDSWLIPERDDAFKRYGIDWFESDLNSPTALSGLASESMKIALMGEVFEHVFNHPLGLLREIRRVLAPGGILILTTPNPATFVNAVRMILGRYSLWGTGEFIAQPKIQNGRVRFTGEIHFREYLAREVISALEQAGFEVVKVRYLPIGAGLGQPLWKRALKRVAGKTLMRMRPFASTSYFIATRIQVDSVSQHDNASSQDGSEPASASR